jgi:hypothetical protein
MDIILHNETNAILCSKPIMVGYFVGRYIFLIKLNYILEYLLQSNFI